MLTKQQVQRFSSESGLRDIMIAEKEIILTFLLQLLSERKLLDKLAFKGGTCIRKMILGNQGRFSTDLDFTAIEKHDHQDLILEMMAVFQEPFHEIQFKVPDAAYYAADDGLSWGVTPTYTHDWNPGGNSEVKIQVSLREVPSISPKPKSQVPQSYFNQLPFVPIEIHCLDHEEILAEKIRACYQRNKVRDLYDLGLFALKPYRRELVRRLVVIKLWQVRDIFDPARLMKKFQEGVKLNWDDLTQLLRRGVGVDPKRISEDCIRGFGYLANLTEDESLVAKDRYQRESEAVERLRQLI